MHHTMGLELNSTMGGGVNEFVWFRCERWRNKKNWCSECTKTCEPALTWNSCGALLCPLWRRIFNELPSKRCWLQMYVKPLEDNNRSAIINNFIQLSARQITLILADSYLIERLTFPCILLLQSITVRCLNKKL